ncbi:MAG TPA: metalloregulator ArsR/SmtB family transcription factor [Ktedonobacteraceae bacterium]|nr:metalloregulator ArsR/SmtB family transcription factor [Ktedonobacteraceae bacterium]
MVDTEKNAAAQRREAYRGMPPVEIEMGLAYEFIQSLLIYYEQECHEKEYEYEIGAAWFENIRTTCSQDLLERLADLTPQVRSERGWLHDWSHLLGMVYDSPAPKDVPTFLSYLELLDPLEIRLYWLGYYERRLRKIMPLDVILRVAEGDEEALEQFFKTALPTSSVAQEQIRQFVSADGETLKSTIVRLLWQWYEQVFRSQEEQIRAILERDIEAKRKLQATYSPEKLVELATNGLIYGPEAGVRKIVLVPSFLVRPWNETPTHQDVKLYIYPVADSSVMLDRSVPPAQLVRLYQALADERRLRILKLLKARSYSLQEISDEFGAAKSTMHHHLALLRTAGLVRIRDDEKQYSLRQEKLATVSKLLEDFLND